MSEYTYILTSWESVGNYKKIIEIAKKHQKLCDKDDTEFTEKYFESIINKKSLFGDHDIWIYGGIFRNIYAYMPIDELIQFFTNLYETQHIINDSRIMFFEQRVPQNKVNIYQIFLKNPEFKKNNEKPILETQLSESNGWRWNTYF